MCMQTYNYIYMYIYIYIYTHTHTHTYTSIVTRSNEQVGKITTLKKCKLHVSNRLIIKSSRAIQLHSRKANVTTDKYLLQKHSEYSFKMHVYTCRILRQWNSSHFVIKTSFKRRRVLKQKKPLTNKELIFGEIFQSSLLFSFISSP